MKDQENESSVQIGVYMNDEQRIAVSVYIIYTPCAIKCMQ